MLGDRGNRLEIVPTGLFPATSPIQHHSNFLEVTLRIVANGFSANRNITAGLGDLFTTLATLENWKPDVSSGFEAHFGSDASIKTVRDATAQGWQLHFRLSGDDVSLQGSFTLDRESIEPCRAELASIVRCINAAEL